MNKDKIKQIALDAGFKLKKQPNGSMYYAMTEPDENGECLQTVFFANNGRDIYWGLDANGFSPYNTKFCKTNRLPTFSWHSIPPDNLLEIPDEISQQAEEATSYCDIYNCGDTFFDKKTQWYRLDEYGYDIVKCEPYPAYKKAGEE